MIDSLEKRDKAIQLLKATALNSISKMYHPKFEFQKVSFYDDETYAEMRDRKIRYIIEDLERDIREIKQKYSLHLSKKK